MPKILRIISGVLFAILPIIGFGIFGMAWYVSFPNLFGIILFLIITGLGIFLGVKTFQKVRIVGGIEFLSKSVSSNDMNNLQVTSDSTNRIFDVKDYVLLHNKNENIFKGGCIRIFGDWYGEPYMNWRGIENLIYNQNSSKLVIKLSNDEKVVLNNPNVVIEDNRCYNGYNNIE
ncbi:MAG: hypothetical protein ACI9XO_001194 [Paraglaciecola sp.]|jgi:hypothetical protein